jgi:uncharacterized protein (TIGR03066 family)
VRTSDGSRYKKAGSPSRPFLSKKGDVMRAMLGCVVALALCCGLLAEDKKADPIDAKKLVGKWGPKEKKEGQTFVVEYAKDGKVTFTHTADGKESKSEGTYKVDGNKLAMTYKVGEKESVRTLTVSKLTDAELVIADEKGQEQTLVLLKDK